MRGCEALGAANLRGTGFAAKDIEVRTLTAKVGGVQHVAEVNVTGLAGFLLAKCALEHSQRKRKDWHDIAFVLLHNDQGGHDAAIRRVLELFRDDLPILRTALGDLQANFADPRTQGPTAYADQMLVDHEGWRHPARRRGPRRRGVLRRAPQVDDLTAKRDALAAGTPVVRLADDATITRYVERLHAALATGSVNVQRAILRSWISRIEADGTQLTVTFTLPPDVGGGSQTNEGQNPGLTVVLPRVGNGGLSATRGRTIERVVRVRTCREIREVEPAPEVPREQRAEVWARWLAEGRYRSGAELARAAGVSRETVSAALRAKR